MLEQTLLKILGKKILLENFLIYIVGLVEEIIDKSDMTYFVNYMMKPANERTMVDEEIYGTLIVQLEEELHLTTSLAEEILNLVWTKNVEDAEKLILNASSLEVEQLANLFRN